MKSTSMNAENIINAKHDNNNGDKPMTTDINDKMHHAVMRGQLDAVKALVGEGADVNAQLDDNGNTPLIIAATGGIYIEYEAAGKYLEIVQYLISQGADIDEPNGDGVTPLFSASYYGDLDIAKYLVAQGADVHAEKDTGTTPLMTAADAGYLKVVKFLANKGANVNARDKENRTPLWWAASNNYLDVVQYLVAKGAKVDAMDKDGQTPLTMAAINNHLPIVQYLVANGANVHVMDKDGQRLLFTLTSKAQLILDIIDALQQHGTKEEKK